ncbi:leucine-rich repeat receptor-like protein kinase [Hibiscus syriacus]|uniref:Leucine-rich repeat receptor-like protein kinase n=1 Tax=Hibiscus syriacus TaxID=106335 RepID=A0A6A3CFL5_HIBSY|nr:probably inactive leucine-rich repeat receptor-like protein kinase At3g28040 [Hibiscus syriacus]KAE8728085.1 leucine-rich repeat receptor-like protein kinase [Hibiscus syriacus]
MKTMGIITKGSLHVLICLLLFMDFCMGDDEASSIKLNDDVLGLTVFKSDIKDPSSYLQSWNEDDNSPCSWRFIKCYPNNGRVSEISLDGLGLSGKIGKGIQKLEYLKVLSLSHNNFSGTISRGFDVLNRLKRLNLSYNNLSGSIPSSFVNMNSLRFLDLSGNSLSGSLPDELFQSCSSLRSLSLAENSFEGQLPSTLYRCSYLNNLNLSNNHFSGNIDFVSGIWWMNRLRSLDLSYNSFSGSVPDGVLALHYLKRLHLQSNGFSGPMPADIGLCPHLNSLDLSHNLFDGPLPDSLQRLNSLVLFSLSNNMFTSEFPPWIGNLSSLEYLDLSSNNLTGRLPLSIGNLKALQYLRLSNNKLIGSIPAGLFDLGLENMDLSDNRFNGLIPIGSNSLFEALRNLDLSRNDLEGTIPGEMGLFANMRYLNLSWNKLQSRIPPELGLFSNLTVLDLRENALSGDIPEDICESGSLVILQLDGNSLSGPIPDEIGNCSSLYSLTLSHNNLTGSIPKSVSELTELKILKLEFNELSGEIPKELGLLENLLAVNVSYNQLIGRLPVGGIFPSLDQSALQGNLGICSPLLKGPCKLNVPKPLVLDPDAYNGQMGGHRQRNESAVPMRSYHHISLSVSAIVAISAGVLIVTMVIIVSLLNVAVRRRLEFVETALESMCSGSTKSGSPPAGKLILFNSKLSTSGIGNPEILLNKAAEIGEGVFGTVYKVPLSRQGRFMAIKKLATSNLIQYPDDFDQEVRVLGKARHPNLISLEGYYWTPQIQLLITEYENNGNLQTKLHERSGSVTPLSWSNRFKIIAGIAKGLSYLHHSFRPPIIHYDIKPSNILLDEDYNPKISDFGLARLLTRLENHVISNRFQGALGYVAPELACQSLRVNEKCDVFGFGTLILELVTGRRPVKYGEDNVVILSDHVRVSVEQGNVLDCVDASMGDYTEDEVFPVLKLALVCTSQIPSSRPSMAEVVQILQVIKTPVPQTMETP